MNCIDPRRRSTGYAEGDMMKADSVVCTIEGPARALLTAERAALNFLQLLSGVATATRRMWTWCRHPRGHPRYPQDLAGPAPGAEVRGACGRRPNQRLALYDGILIKENHIAAAGGITAAVAAALNSTPA
jgi:nicotinate-nucleotide pyrophosphorylase (carboxylating)